VCEPVVKKATQEYLIGGQINCAVTVANGGVVLSGHPVHVRLDVENLSRYPVDQITITIYQHITFTAPLNGVTQELKRMRQVLLAGVKDVDIRENQRFSRIVKIASKADSKWAPSVTLAQHISVTYELVANFFALAENIEIRVPLMIRQYSPLLKDELPQKIEPNFGEDVDFTPTWLADLRRDAEAQDESPTGPTQEQAEQGI